MKIDRKKVFYKISSALIVIGLVAFMWFFSKDIQTFSVMISENRTARVDDCEKEISQIKNVILGDGYYLVLGEDGKVWILRKNDDTQSELEENKVLIPQRVSELNNIIEIVDGGDEIYVLTEDGYVYVWGKEFSNFSYESNDDIILCESVKVENMENIIDIEAKNNRMFAMDKNGCIYALGMYLDAEYDKRDEVMVLFDEEKQKLMGKVTDIVAGAGNYHYYIREDGTVFSVMQYWYEGNGAPYAFIFPSIIKDKLGLQEDEFYYWPEELDDIVILNDSTKEGYTIYYNLEGVDKIKKASADPYTVFLVKEDETLWYWNSDRIKYHDNEFALIESEYGEESREGEFAEVKITDIFVEDAGENTLGISDIQSGAENTLFLMEDGRVFISQYETYKVQDVEYYRRNNPAPEKLDSVLTAQDVELKQLVFKKLDLENIVGIYTDGNNAFLAIDSQGRFYDINVTATSDLERDDSCFELECVGQVQMSENFSELNATENSEDVFEEINYIDDELYITIKDIYDKIDFYGCFQPGDIAKYEMYKKAYKEVLDGVKKVNLSETEECYIWDVEELAVDNENYSYYFFDMNGNGNPELCITDNAWFTYVFSYEEESDQVILWQEYISNTIFFMGTQKLGFAGGWSGDGFISVDNSGDYEYFVRFKVVGGEPYKNEIEEYGYLISLPEYIELSDDMKSQAVYDQADERYYFRVTEEQYNELTEKYYEAVKNAQEQLSHVTYTYEELFD